MKRKKLLYAAPAVLAVLAVAAWIYAGGGKEVGTVQARPGAITRTVDDTGYVQAAASFDIHAAQGARVAAVPVEIGQTVEKGQTLAVLENLDLALQISDINSRRSQAVAAAGGARAALERLRLELQDAQDNLDRTEMLFQAGAVGRVELDQAGLRVDTAQEDIVEQNSALEGALALEAGLDDSLRQLGAKEGQLVIKSPADGIVLALPVKQGQVINPGALLANVAEQDRLEVKADVLSDDLADIKTGQRVIITAPLLGGRELAGEVEKIYPQAEEKTSALGVIQRRVPVIISLPEPANLKPGFEVRVSIVTTTRQDVPVLPREAVRTLAGGQKEVMVVIDKRIQYRTVQTGISDQENIEITGGLTTDELVVLDGSLNLAEKTRVK